MIDIQHSAISLGQSIQDAYDDLYRERTLLLRDSTYLWMIECLDPKPGEILVDVACGNGRLVELAATQGIHAIGVDLSFQGLEQVAQVAPAPASWVVSDGQNIAMPDGVADYVMSIGSLEHYDDPQQGAAELARILKPDGRAFIVLPNAYGLLGNIKYVWQHGEVWDDGQPHQRYATRATWQAMLLRAGLAAERVVGWNELNRPRTRADFDALARHPHKLVRAGLSLLPANVANHVVYVCRHATVAERQSVTEHYGTLPRHFARHDL